MIQAARRIVEKLKRHGHEAYFAGGWVRDSLLGRKSKDIDIATSALPGEVHSIFPHTLNTGARFGVVQVRMYGRDYQVATFRTETGYIDGRHPSSVTFSGPQQDALRRDFTINGLFYSPETERILDYVRGRFDLESRIIRTIGNPYERFNEDKLRLLRAVRFAVTLDFRIEPETWNALTALAPEIVQVSWERIRDELAAILTGPAPGAGLNLLYKSGLLYHVLPEFKTIHHEYSDSFTAEDLLGYTQRALDLLRRPSRILAFSALLHGLELSPFPSDRDSTASKLKQRPVEREIPDICRRIRISVAETRQITDLIRTLPILSEGRKMPVSTLKRMFRKPFCSELLELYRIRVKSLGMNPAGHRFFRKKLKEYIKDIYSKPFINGDDLISLGYYPGPVFRRILHSVENLQLEGDVKSRKEAISFIRKNFPLTGK